MALHYVFIACLSHYSPVFILRGRYDGSLVRGRIHHKIFHIKDGTAHLSCAAFVSIYGMAAFCRMKIHNAMQEQNKVKPFPEQPVHSPQASEDLLIILIIEKGTIPSAWHRATKHRAVSMPVHHHKPTSTVFNTRLKHPICPHDMRSGCQELPLASSGLPE